MTTLAADVAIGDTQLTIDARMTDVPTGGFAVKVDDELLQVGGVEYRDGLVLALKAPTTAAHSSGATVTQVLDAFTTDATSPFADGSGVQTIRLLGPFRVAHNTAGINSQISVATLAADTVVIRAFARIITSFTDTGQGLLQIGAGGSTAVSEGNYQTCIDYSLATTQEDSGSWVEPGDVAVNGVVALKEAGHLVVHISSGEATGVADIYALVAEPA